VKDPIDAATEKATNATTKIVGGAGGVLVLLFILAQMSGGIKLLGDWRAGDKEAVRLELLHGQQHQRLDQMRAYLKHLCQKGRDEGDKLFDCTKL